ncbi:MAG: TolC family protein [Bacteroidota bacterium]
MKLISIFFIAFLALQSFGQSQISLAEAIAKAIAQNPSIKIQKMESQMAENKVFKANAGKLPTIDAVGSATYANNFADVKLRTFQPDPEFIEIDEFGVETWNANLGVQANYVVFDGGRSDYRLQLLQGLSDVEQAKQQVLVNETTLGVSRLYLEILKLQNQAAFLSENIENSKARIQKMEDRKQFGQTNQLSILQLQTALNQDEAALDDVLLVKANLVRDLNFLMGATLEEDFEVLAIDRQVALPNLETVQAAILSNNPQLKLSKLGIAIAGTELQLNQLDRQPSVAAFATVGYNYQNNDVQQLAEIQTAGVMLGFNARYNLFDGGIRKNRIQNAQIGVEIANSRRQLLEEDLRNRALKEHSSIVLLQSQLAREQQNLKTFEEAYTKTQDLFEAGKTNNLALRDAQLARLNVLLRIDQLKVDVLMADMRLQQLMGKL